MRKMMKCGRLPLLLFLCLCMLQLAACQGREEEQSGNAYQVYYLNREETRITAVTAYLEEESQEEQVKALLDTMALTPEDVTLKATVGSSFQVTGYKIEEGQLNLEVDEAYYKLSPTTEVLARAALVRTLSQAEGINHVVMYVGGQALTDRSGAAIGPMTADSFIDNAGEEINTNEMVTLKLYFTNQSGDRLVETSMTMEYNTNISQEKLVVDCLVKGPDMEGAYPVLNPSTRVLSVTVKDGICYVNFDESFLTQVYNVTADVVIYSITNSLVELPNVNKVQIAVNGKTDLVFRENFPLSNIYERNLGLGEQETDTQTETDTGTETDTQTEVQE